MQSQNQDNDNGRSAPFVRRATQQTSLSELWSQDISIHALREEGDGWRWRSAPPLPVFLSTPSARRATGAVCGAFGTSTGFLSTPSARRATRGAGRKTPFAGVISIHALREEGDAGAASANGGAVDFYPRPPRGGRPFRTHRSLFAAQFLSTPSARRATMSAVQVLDAMLDISIHALREEGDDKLAGLGQSSNISIHALREEGDQLSWKSRRPMFNFYPRPPRGGRLVNRMNCPVDFSFLSTPSARRATYDRPPAPAH